MKSEPLSAIGSQTAKTSIRSDVTDGLIFDVRTLDYIVLHLVQSTTWPASFVLTLQCAIGAKGDWSGFPSAITYTSQGVKTAVSVAGIDYVRLYTSTTDGSITVDVRANGLRDGAA